MPCTFGCVVTDHVILLARFGGSVCAVNVTGVPATAMLPSPGAAIESRCICLSFFCLVRVLMMIATPTAANPAPIAPSASTVMEVLPPRPGVGVGVGLGVDAGVGVGVYGGGTMIAVAAGVRAGVAGVRVGFGVGVAVGRGVGVGVGRGVGVAVAVGVGVGVGRGVGRRVGCDVGVAVGIGVSFGVSFGVGVGLGVGVGCGVGVGVDGGRNGANAPLRQIVRATPRWLRHSVVSSRNGRDGRPRFARQFATLGTAGLAADRGTATPFTPPAGAAVAGTVVLMHVSKRAVSAFGVTL